MIKKLKKCLGMLSLAIFFMMLLVFLVPASVADAETTTAIADFQINEGKLVKYHGEASIVSIPYGVESIGEEAFAGNTKITAVAIPNTVETIYYGAFAGCTSLTQVIIPDSTTTIGNGVFANCSSLQKVLVGANLKDVGCGVFVGCYELDFFAISPYNTDLSYYSGALYNGDKTKLIQLLPGRDASVFVFPSTVTEISPYAFWGAKNLEQVLLSQGLHEVPAYAFSNCEKLEGIEIPYSVYKIAPKAFENCENLKEVIMYESVNEIHDSAFDGCYNMYITAPDYTYAYEYAQSHPAPEKPQPLYTLDEQQSTTLQGNSNTGNVQADTQIQNNNGTNNNGANNSASGSVNGNPSGYVDPLEWPDDANVLGKTRIVGNDAFVIIEGTKPTVY